MPVISSLQSFSWLLTGTGPFCQRVPQQAEGDFPTICGELLPYCDEEEAASLRQMQSMMQQWENMQEMLQTVQLMQELMPQGDSGEGSPFPSPDNMDLEQMMNLFNMMKSS